MMKSLQGKFLLIFMFALILNLFRINMAQSTETDSFNLMSLDTLIDHAITLKE